MLTARCLSHAMLIACTCGQEGSIDSLSLYQNQVARFITEHRAREPALA